MGPTICLGLLMKNESASTEALLRSCAGTVASVVLLDTGSDDDTIEKARRVCAEIGLPLHLHEEPFVDFSTSRNRVIELAEAHAEWVLLLSGDEQLAGGDALRPALAAAASDCSAFDLTVVMGGTSFGSPRVLRSSARLRYVGPVHEYIEFRGMSHATAHGVFVPHDMSSRDAARARRRFEELDLPLLLAETQKPDCPGRWHFYIAQTYECLDRWSEAVLAFRKRIVVGGWDEETFEAHLRLGKCAIAAGMPESIWREAFMAAYRRRPHRAEPLHARARKYWARARGADATLYATAAAGKKRPTTDRLFVDDEVYRWRANEILSMSAWHIMEMEIGLRASLLAYEARPDLPHLKANLEFYQKTHSQ